MPTNHQLWVSYLNEDKTLDTRRCVADQPDLLADIRDVIEIRFRRFSQGQYFEDSYNGSDCYKIDRTQGPGGEYTNVLRCRPKNGGTKAEAVQVSYQDPDFQPNENPVSKTLPDTIIETSMGGSGSRLYSYDPSASDFDTLLDESRLLDSDATPIS